MPTKPRTGESKNDFLNRCIPILIKEGKTQEEAVAICISIYENKDLLQEKNMLKIYQKYFKKINNK